MKVLLDKNVKVIVFTMAFNAENTIERTINSILGQTFGNFEYYILDNGATDRTGEIIQRYAAMDERINPIRLNKNDPTNGGALFCLLARVSSADYIVWCDADDTYSPAFLEKMTAFAQENSLDIAACGYEKIDSVSGAVLKRKAIAENLIVSESDFTEQFIQYRGFTSFLWGKLYSLQFLGAARQALGTAPAHHICADSLDSLQFWRNARRVGIYNEAMYQYYQYPHALSKTGIENCLESYQILWRTTRDYLGSYGPISDLNMDFLYAIYLSLTDEAAERILMSESVDNQKKLGMLRELFHYPLWAETLARKADPQFHNLAARREYVAQMKDRIYALAATPLQREMAEAAVLELDKPIA